MYVSIIVALPLGVVTSNFEFFKYTILSILALVPFALLIIPLAFFQKCTLCNKRILILPTNGRYEKLVKSTSMWYESFGELIDVIKTGKLPCHHCGNTLIYK
ncbi:hypothetical protein SOPP22_16730 [Shewanella sp. OPT22]|nr:hypothetical protein SOPP22_16730 [Shewanella sp. OPT22]